jgi:hypothetical protein
VKWLWKVFIEIYIAKDELFLILKKEEITAKINVNLQKTKLHA